MTKLIILIGPPSSGKTTLAHKLAGFYEHGVVIDTSKALEDHGCFDEAGSERRKSGLLINDHSVCSAVQIELNQALQKKPNIAVLVGFPRETERQFQAVERFIINGLKFQTHHTLIWHLSYGHDVCLRLFEKGANADRSDRPDNDIEVFNRRLGRHVERTVPRIRDLIRYGLCPHLETRSLEETGVVNRGTLESLFTHFSHQEVE